MLHSCFEFFNALHIFEPIMYSTCLTHSVRAFNMFFPLFSLIYNLTNRSVLFSCHSQFNWFNSIITAPSVMWSVTCSPRLSYSLSFDLSSAALSRILPAHTERPFEIQSIYIYFPIFLLPISFNSQNPDEDISAVPPLRVVCHNKSEFK